MFDLQKDRYGRLIALLFLPFSFFGVGLLTPSVLELDFGLSCDGRRSCTWRPSCQSFWVRSPVKPSIRVILGVSHLFERAGSRAQILLPSVALEHKLTI